MQIFHLNSVYKIKVRIEQRSSSFTNMIATSDMRSLLAIWIILLLNKTTIAQNGFMFPTSVCDGKDGRLFPMFGSCQSYYICNNGMAIVGTCDEKSRFNPTTLHCDDANKVQCAYDEADDSYDDNDEDEDDDDIFESSSVEVKETTTTRRPPLKQTKPITTPVPFIKPNKDFEQTTDRLCLGKKNGVSLIKDGSCSEYYVCKAKRPHLRHCPANQHFSSSRQICMNAEDAKCAFNQQAVHHDTPAITAGLCSESRQDSLVPHREDCGKFLLCSNMMFLVMDCPMGLHFNAEAKRCDYPKVAQCATQKVQSKTKKSAKKSLSKRKPKRNTL
ncbi:probable chitinase 10 [Drosophila albomicans]|uniref:Probable chitinase 10 n=1 Tax=Drosophila albomicans TaxID=7291 RepID=A0A6P8WZR9_DROAB|nr:probable chitinase 10 [Drosophila albomicans]